MGVCCTELCCRMKDGCLVFSDGRVCCAGLCCKMRDGCLVFSDKSMLCWTMLQDEGWMLSV